MITVWVHIAWCQNLDAYVNVTAIWLDNNLLTAVPVLDFMSKLRFLYLQSNSIEQIANLGALTLLDTLNLCDNQITEISDLSALKSLKNLMLDRNKIAGIAGLRGSSVQVLSLTKNAIEDAKALDILATIASLRCLYIKGAHSSLLVPVAQSSLSQTIRFRRRPASDVASSGGTSHTTCSPAHAFCVC